MLSCNTERGDLDPAKEIRCFNWYKAGLKTREGCISEAVQPGDGAAAFRHSVPRCNAEIRENEHAARKWVGFAFSWSETLFRVKHTVRAFPSHCIQLHSKEKEVAFLPQSSFDMATPVARRPLGIAQGMQRQSS